MTADISTPGPSTGAAALQGLIQTGAAALQDAYGQRRLGHLCDYRDDVAAVVLSAVLADPALLRAVLDAGPADPDDSGRMDIALMPGVTVTDGEFTGMICSRTTRRGPHREIVVRGDDYDRHYVNKEIAALRVVA